MEVKKATAATKKKMLQKINIDRVDDGYVKALNKFIYRPNRADPIEPALISHESWVTISIYSEAYRIS